MLLSRPRACLTLAVVLSLGGAPLALAAPDPEPEIFLHLVAGGATTCAAGMPSDPSAVVTTGGLWSGTGTGYYAYLIVARDLVPTIAGFQVGLSYDDGAAGGQSDEAGVDILGWHDCADIEFMTPVPLWPAPGSANLITWAVEKDRCQSGTYAVAGYFYVAAFSPGRLSLIPRPSDGAAKVADCRSFEYQVSAESLGFVEFSAGSVQAGCNPLLGDCVDQVPVETRTWSGVKTLVTGGP